MRIMRLGSATVAFLVAVGCGQEPTTPGIDGLSLSHVAPTPTDAPNSGACGFLGIDTELKIEPVVSGTTGPITLTVQNSTFNWSSTTTVLAVVVKGGPGANLYDYRPLGGETSDDGLHAPVNPNNGRFFGLSHVSFCLGDKPPPPK